VNYPVLRPHTKELKKILETEAELLPKSRRTAKKIYEVLQREGYIGRYDAVCRYIKGWKEERKSRHNAYVSLQFGKGEAFQFDWSQETVEIGGVVRKVEVAQVRLCYGRMRFCMAFFREELPMVMEAHTKAHDFFGGLCERGIYDNPKTIVQSIGRGAQWASVRKLGTA
jgi:transposase